jgi:2'-5' RNA ligase
MAFSLNLRADHAPSITALWDEVARFEDVGSMRALDYAPHFTFAIYDDDAVSETMARRAMERAAVGETMVSVAFRTIRTFAGPPLVVWAEPDPCQALARMHAAIHQTIDPTLCRSHYRPGAWVAHCTLGTRIREEHRAHATAFAEGFRGRIEARFDTLDCVMFPPLRIVTDKRLASAS